jgi:hypothetical protein
MVDKKIRLKRGKFPKILDNAKTEEYNYIKTKGKNFMKTYKSYFYFYFNSKFSISR